MGEPLARPHVARRLRIVDAAGFQTLELVVQKRAALQQLQVERTLAPLALQETQRAPEHGVAGGLGRQRDIQAAMIEAALQLKMRIKRRFGLAFAHRRFDKQDSGLAQSRKRVRHGLLQGAGRESEHLVEGFLRSGERCPCRPANRVQRLFSIFSAASGEPCG